MSGMPIPPNMAAIIALALIGVAMLWIRDPVYFQQAGPPKKYKSHYVHRLRRIGNMIAEQRRNDPVAGVIAVALLAWAAFLSILCAFLSPSVAKLNRELVTPSDRREHYRR